MFSGSDGISYTCECTAVKSWGQYHGDGFSCARYRHAAATSIDNFAEFCQKESSTTFIFEIAKFENEAEFNSWASDVTLKETGTGMMMKDGKLVHIKDDSLVEWTPSPMTGSLSDGDCIIWNSDSSTFSYSNCNENHRIACESQESKICSKTWNGYLYRGDLNEPQDGETCMNWADVPQQYIDDLSIDQSVDHGLVGNKCRNPNRGIDGPFCFTNLEPKDGFNGLSRSACLVSRCEDLSARHCRIQSAQPGNRYIGYTVSTD